MAAALILILSADVFSLAPGQVKTKTPGDVKIEDKDTIRLSTILVQVPLIVTGIQGRFITGLTQKDFSVFEDGKPQEIATFSSTKQPFKAVLLVDTSNSTEERLKAIQNTAICFINEVRPDDRAMVVTFDHEVKALTDFTSDHIELTDAINGAESGFGKLLYEGVALALEKLKDVEGRRAVILFTDGVDMKSIEATLESNLKKAEEIGAVIYAVQFETRWWIEAAARRQQAEHPKSQVPFDYDMRIPLPPGLGGPDTTSPEFPKVKKPKIEINPRTTPAIIVDGKRVDQSPEPKDQITQTLDKLYGDADSYLNELTLRTGGRLFPACDFDDSRAAFAAVADELRNQYFIGYYSPRKKNDGRYHKIKVEVKWKDSKVRSRPGYRETS